MARKIEHYMCARCTYGQNTDFDVCPACGWIHSMMRYAYEKKGWKGKGPGMEVRFTAEHTEFTDWFERQPSKHTSQVWMEGYAEGRMQEKYKIVDFPELIAKKPTGLAIEEDEEDEHNIN